MKEWLHVRPSPERANENVYYLNKNGCDYLGLDEERRWVQSVEHYLMRNDLYLYYGMPESFQVEAEITISSGLAQKILRADGYFIKDGLHYFLEVDRMQKMSENKKKIELYSELSPLMAQKYETHPTIVFYTNSHIRQKKLYQWCKELNVSCSVYTKDDLK
jgi:hypothetical protein